MEKKKVRRYTRREVRRNRMIAFCCLVVLAILLIALIVWGIKNLVSGDDGKSSSESSLGTVSTSQSSSPDNASNSDSSLSGAVVSGGDSSADESASGASSSSSSSKVSSSTSTSSINSSDPYYESSMPLLVNPDHLMPDDYSPTVVSVGGNYKLESKAAAAWQDMQAAASRDGVSLWIISAYRTLERQTELYQEKVEEYKNLGYNEGDAKIEAGKWVAVPGTSEHSDQFAWLQKHCAEYGFILRYPKDKVDITKISYEPWHYRYVGSNHAQIIMSQGLCLEEYLEQYSS